MNNQIFDDPPHCPLSEWESFYWSHTGDNPHPFPPGAEIGATVAMRMDQGWGAPMGALATIVERNSFPDNAVIGVRFWDPKWNEDFIRPSDKLHWYHYTHFMPVHEEEAALCAIAQRTKEFSDAQSAVRGQ